MFQTIRFASLILVVLFFSGCGGGGGSGNTAQAHQAYVASLKASDIHNMSDADIQGLGSDIKFLSDAALVVLDYHTGNNNPLGQIESISAAQIDVLTPAQVRLIGATGAGGTIGTSKISDLNTGAWSALVSNSQQVAAITPAEVATLWDTQVVAFGANINSLTNPDLVALTCFVNLNGTNPVGQIESISATEIAALSTSQVRMIGAAGPGGTIGTSQLSCMNSGAWSTLTSDPVQVAAITPQEIATFPDSFIPTLGANINQLADFSLASLSVYVNLNGTNPVGQIETISAAEINALSPTQVSILAGITSPYGAATAIAYLNTGAFSVLSALQTPVLTANNVLGVNATQLASLSTAALAALPSATRSSLTVTQKASLTAPQHTACGC